MEEDMGEQHAGHDLAPASIRKPPAATPGRTPATSTSSRPYRSVATSTGEASRTSSTVAPTSVGFWRKHVVAPGHQLHRPEPGENAGRGGGSERDRGSALIAVLAVISRSSKLMGTDRSGWLSTSLVWLACIGMAGGCHWARPQRREAVMRVVERRRVSLSNHRPRVVCKGGDIDGPGQSPDA